MRRLMYVSAVLITCANAQLHAQRIQDARASSLMKLRAPRQDTGSLSLILPAHATTGAARDSWWAPLASTVAPGLGQAVLHQDRALAYVALEAFLLVRYVGDRDESRLQRTSYKTLARTVARALFADGGLPDGDFDYYERMEHFAESGVFSMAPEPLVEPERDSITFNGSVWRLARETFWKNPAIPPERTSPEYQRSLAFYLSRAVRPEFRWSWRNAQLEHDLYVRTIATSNRAFQRSIANLGALLANHALSTVDAYVTLRLRLHAVDHSGAEGSQLEASIPWPPFGR